MSFAFSSGARKIVGMASIDAALSVWRKKGPSYEYLNQSCPPLSIHHRTDV